MNLVKREGFAGVVVLLIILAAAIVGGLIYAHSVQTPAQQNKEPRATAVNKLFQNITHSTSTTNATETVQAATEVPEKCNDDFSCLIAAASDDCAPASAQFAFQSSAAAQNNQTSGIGLTIPGLTTTLKVNYRIEGSAADGRCSVYKDIVGLSIQASPSLIQQSLASGMTMAQFNEQLAQLNDLVAVPPDFYGVCTFTASGLSADIHALQSGGLNGVTSISTTFVAATTTGGTIRDVCGNYYKN